MRYREPAGPAAVGVCAGLVARSRTGSRAEPTVRETACFPHYDDDRLLASASRASSVCWLMLRHGSSETWACAGELTPAAGNGPGRDAGADRVRGGRLSLAARGGSPCRPGPA